MHPMGLGYFFVVSRWRTYPGHVASPASMSFTRPHLHRLSPRRLLCVRLESGPACTYVRFSLVYGSGEGIAVI